MAPGEDVERGRASSAAERQKSIVSMTEFEGMDEYTALQKYILFYRDPRSAGHAQEEAPKKKKWWQSGGGQAAGGADLAAEVPDDCKFLSIIQLHSQHINWQQ
jgi:H+-transporting ATPase